MGSCQSLFPYSDLLCNARAVWFVDFQGGGNTSATKWFHTRRSRRLGSSKRTSVRGVRGRERRLSVEGLEPRSAPSDSFLALVGLGMALGDPPWLGGSDETASDQVRFEEMCASAALPAPNETRWAYTSHDAPARLLPRADIESARSASGQGPAGAYATDPYLLQLAQKGDGSGPDRLDRDLLDDLLAFPLGDFLVEASRGVPSRSGAGGAALGGAGSAGAGAVGAAFSGSVPPGGAPPKGAPVGNSIRVPPPRAHGAIRPLRFDGAASAESAAPPSKEGPGNKGPITLDSGGLGGSGGSGGNTPPIAGNDSYATLHDETLSVSAPGVLANDSDSDYDPLTAVLGSGPSNAASFTLNSDGSFVYDPAAGFFGEDSFTYYAHDGTESSQQSATVTIGVMNTPPIAGSDSYCTEHDVALEVSAPGVMQDDSDSDGDPITAVLDSGPTNAVAFTFNGDGSFTYDPQPLWAGSDSFTYHVTDDLEESNVATVTIGVMNTPPHRRQRLLLHAARRGLESIRARGDAERLRQRRRPNDGGAGDGPLARRCIHFQQRREFHVHTHVPLCGRGQLHVLRYR